MNSSKKTRFSLAVLILDDFIRNQKLAIFITVLIIMTAMSVLITTQHTRKQLLVREQLFLERDVLESEWRNLIIEENVLADPKRIEQKAKNLLGMQYVTPKNETVIVIKNRQ